MIAHLWGDEAHAVLGTYCAKYSVDYVDVNSVDSDLGDDEYLTNGDKIARGATMSFVANGPSPLPFQVTLDSSGCTTVDLTNAVTWQIKLLAEATVDGNTFDVRNSVAGNGVWVGWLETAHTPSTGTHTMDTNLHDAWNIMAAASFAMEVRDGGLSGHTFSFFTEDARASRGRPANGSRTSSSRPGTRTGSTSSRTSSGTR